MARYFSIIAAVWVCLGNSISAGETWTGAPVERPVAVELSGGLSTPVSDAYTERLTDFGFHDQLFLRPHLRLGGAYGVHQHFQIVAELSMLDNGHHRRDNPEGPHEFYWSTVGLGVYLRGVLPVAGGVAVPFVQAGAGVGRARTRYEQGAAISDVEKFYGYHLGVAGGLQIMPWRRAGLFARMGYDHAPIISNLLGDRHDSGGVSVDIGVRVVFQGGRP